MPIEVAAVLAIAVIPWPERIPVALPLIVVATALRLVRGKSWGELFHGRGALIGLLAGLVALGLGIVLGTPVVEHVADRAVEWSRFPMVRGSVGQLVTVVLLVAAMTAAVELALRGWIVERVLELGGHPVIAVMVGGFAEALLTDGGPTAKLGGGLFGMGLGWMYVGSGRNLGAPLCARLAFAVGATVLECARVIG